jgi:hypothetical protein
MLTEIARILASSTAEIQEPRIGRETLQPFDQQRRWAMPPLAPAGDALLGRPFVRVDRLQDKLSCAIVSHASPQYS